VRRTGALLVAENHQKKNGLGYELAATLLKEEPVPFDHLGLEDRFAESGNYFDMIDKFGFSAAKIAQTAERLLDRKKKTTQVEHDSDMAATRK
jgi:transketolase